MQTGKSLPPSQEHGPLDQQIGQITNAYGSSAKLRVIAKRIREVGAAQRLFSRSLQHIADDLAEALNLIADEIERRVVDA